MYAGAHCGYAITDYNRAIAWGQNDMCQLGVMGDIYMSVPVVIGRSDNKILISKS